MHSFALLTLAATAALLVAEWRGWRPGVWIFKPLASTGFVGLALAAGALDSSYGLWVLLALLLCWLGDVLLIPHAAQRVFLAGVASFGLGHLAFAVAFAQLGVAPLACAIAAGLALPAVWAALRWLRPHVPDGMLVPVCAYATVISAMLVLAVGSVARGASPAIALGALLFYVSDLAVARDRFVAPGFSNRAWGLPLYYGGQGVLAWTVAALAA